MPGRSEIDETKDEMCNDAGVREVNGGSFIDVE